MQETDPTKVDQVKSFKDVVTPIERPSETKTNLKEEPDNPLVGMVRSLISDDIWKAMHEQDCTFQLVGTFPDNARVDIHTQVHIPESGGGDRSSNYEKRRYAFHDGETTMSCKPGFKKRFKYRIKHRDSKKHIPPFVEETQIVRDPGVVVVVTQDLSSIRQSPHLSQAFPGFSAEIYVAESKKDEVLGQLNLD